MTRLPRKHLVNPRRRGGKKSGGDLPAVGELEELTSPAQGALSKATGTLGGVTGALGGATGGGEKSGGGGGGGKDTLSLRLDLNLEVEITIKAKIHGDLTLSLL